MSASSSSTGVFSRVLSFMLLPARDESKVGGRGARRQADLPPRSLFQKRGGARAWSDPPLAGGARLDRLPARPPAAHGYRPRRAVGQRTLERIRATCRDVEL